MLHPSLTLHKATNQDLDQIMNLEALGFSRPGWKGEAPDTFKERLLAFPGGFWVVSGYDGKLHGYLCSEIWRFTTAWSIDQFTLNHSASKTHVPEGDELYISSMTVDPEVRGKGIGNALFDGAIKNIFEENQRLKSSILIVSDSWEHARRIYKTHGFLEIGDIEGYLGGEKAIVMRRMLSPP